MTTVTQINGQVATGPRAAARAALDVTLTEAAMEPGTAARLVRPGAAARLAGSLARRSDRVARRVGGFGAEVARVAAGTSQLGSPKGDRRFGDRAWQESWLFHRLMQGYLALDAAVDGLVDDAELDWRADAQTRFMLENLLDAIAPTNLPLTRPQVLKETIDRGGANLVRGGRRLIRDVSMGRLPAMVDTSKFQLGGNLAVSEGSVVAHDEVFELIQYRPTTAEVYETPLLIVPPRSTSSTSSTWLRGGASSSTSSARATKSSPCRGATPTGNMPTSTSTPTRNRCWRPAKRLPRSRDRTPST